MKVPVFYSILNDFSGILTARSPFSSLDIILGSWFPTKIFAIHRQEGRKSKSRNRIAPTISAGLVLIVATNLAKVPRAPKPAMYPTRVEPSGLAIPWVGLYPLIPQSS